MVVIILIEYSTVNLPIKDLLRSFIGLLFGNLTAFKQLIKRNHHHHDKEDKETDGISDAYVSARAAANEEEEEKATGSPSGN